MESLHEETYLGYKILIEHDEYLGQLNYDDREYIEACCYNNFYSTRVESPTGEDIECYASGHEYPYDTCIQEAKNYVDGDIELLRQKHEKRTKTLVQNNVPLLKRV